MCSLCAGIIVCGLRTARCKGEFPVEFDFPIQLSKNLPKDKSEKLTSEKAPIETFENLPARRSENLVAENLQEGGTKNLLSRDAKAAKIVLTGKGDFSFCAQDDIFDVDDEENVPNSPDSITVMFEDPLPDSKTKKKKRLKSKMKLDSF